MDAYTFRKNMKTLFTLILALAMCSCASSRVDSDDKKVHILDFTKFVGSDAFCLVHAMRMSLLPELEGAGTADLPSRFMERHWKDFPNDGYFYPACTKATTNKIWVCPICSSEYARIKKEMDIR